MNKNRFRGFTLIELLVVIAIIGILSAVVLASLNTARQKGNDAAVQSDMSTIQTQAEIYYGGAGSNSYGSTVSDGDCTTSGSMFAADGTIANAISGLENADNSTAVCNTDGSAYAVYAALTSSTDAAWCIDSTGVARQISTATDPGNVTACPAS